MRLRLTPALRAGVAPTALPAATAPAAWTASPFGKPLANGTGAAFETADRCVTLTMPRDTDKPWTRAADEPAGRGAIPRTERGVTGDFVASVRVECPVPKGGRASYRRYGGGLVLTDPADDRFVVYLGVLVDNLGARVTRIDRWVTDLEYVAYFTPPGTGRLTTVRSGGGWNGAAGGAAAAHLRLTRAGPELRLERLDEVTWKSLPLGPIEVDPMVARLPEALSLGLAGYNSLGEKAAVRFTDLSVRQTAPRPAA